MIARLRSWRTAVALAAVAAAGAWGLFLGLWHLHGRGSILDRIEAPLQDWRLLIAGPRAAPDGVVIVAIDEETVRRAGAYPLPRALLARIVRRLADDGAKAIALDMLFLERGPGEADAELAAALRSTPAVIGAAALFPRTDAFAETRLGGGRSAPLPVAERVLWPVSPLAGAAAVGLVNITADHAGTPRYVPLLIASGADLLPSFVLRTAAVAAAAEPELEADAVRIGPSRTSVDFGYHLPLRFYGPRGTVATVSAQAVLDADADAGAAVRGRVVVVGATAIGTADTFATAFDPVLPGVELVATGIAHLVAGKGLVRNGATRRLDLAASVVLPILTVLAFTLRRVGLGVALCAVPFVLWFAFATVAFSRDYWFAMAVPLAATLPPALVFGAVRLWLEQRSKRRVLLQREALRRFHAPAIAEKLAVTPEFLQEPVQQHAAVLFVDLSGFTGLSEQLGPHGTRTLLKAFHSLVEEEATRRDGFVLSFMGDGAMLLFGLPAPKPDDALRAVEAALSLAAALRAWIAERAPGDGRELGARIGLHYGPVVLSRLGPDTHQHITASGDTVNVASRLLEVAAHGEVEAAFSLDVIAAARAAPESGALPSFTGAREIAIRGRARPLAVWLGNPAAPHAVGAAARDSLKID
ncbi:MAG: CHASE2 domain-containing protein [Microvirga sp.]